MNRRRTLLVGAAIAAVIFLVMALVVRSTEPWQSEGNATASESANDVPSVVDVLFGPQVIAFEVLGILLTAAMIGALVIARPLGAIDDDTHYTQPTKEQAAQALAVSDAKSHDTTPLADKPEGPQ